MDGRHVSPRPWGRVPDHDAVEFPAHYTAHPSGVEQIDVSEWFPANLANAWKYLHRVGLKEPTNVDLQKAGWYLRRELRRRRILARQCAAVDVYYPAVLEKTVARYLRHESGRRRELFANLWAAFRSPLSLDPLKDAAELVRLLTFESHLPPADAVGRKART